MTAFTCNPRPWHVVDPPAHCVCTPVFTGDPASPGGESNVPQPMCDRMPTRAMADDDRNDLEAGAPIGKDVLDPELISLRRPAPRIGALAAASIVVLCVALMV